MNTETLKLWREELAAVLATAKTEMPALIAESEAAAESVRKSDRTLRALQADLAPIRRLSPLITARLQEFEDTRSAARGHRVRAAGVLQEHRNRVKELEAALAQLDLIICPPAAEEAA